MDGQAAFSWGFQVGGGMGVWMDVLSGDTRQVSVKSVAFRLSFFACV